jgi:glucosamine--fructose-6-phosphate aminotransferase (isomerizing)
MGEHTIQEIHSQPEVWRRLLEQMRGDSSPLAALDRCARTGPVLFTGCGSSYYASLAAAAAWTRFAGGPAWALSATDVMMYPECHFASGAPGTLVAVSRSGKTPETRSAAAYCKQTLGWPAIGISCNAASAVLEACDAAIVLADAAEKSRFTTRVFTGTILTVLAWAARRAANRELETELDRLPDLACGVIERYGAGMEDLAQNGRFDQYVYLGQGPYYGLASEAMLKTKEMAGTTAEVFHSQEFLHGPKYAAGPSTLTVALLSDGGRQWQLELLPKLKGFGAQVLTVCEEAGPEIREHSDWVCELRSGLSEYGRMLLAMLLLQLFAYHRALALGKSVD